MSKQQDREYKALGRGFDKNRLAELPKQINKLHRKIKKKYWVLVNAARECGGLLIEAKAIKKHGTWKDWIYDNFNGSYETAVVYMRIAREWNSDAIREARKAGLPLNSIKNILDILRNKQFKTKKTLTETQQKEFDHKREYLRAVFDEKLDKLDRTEFKILFNNFDHFWVKLYDQLKNMVCMVWEYDPYVDEKESWKLKKEVRQKVKRALNKK